MSQTYVNLEIILVDDGSTDMSGQICDEYASADKRIRVVHSENKGVSNARNQALDMSTGDYIILLTLMTTYSQFTLNCCWKKQESLTQIVL